MKNWYDTCVSKTDTIRDTLNRINQSSLKIALVVTDKNQLLGTVTDGDIRRAMLNNVSMETPIASIMSRQPKVAKRSTSKRQLIDLMERYMLNSVPIVSEDYIVEDLVSFHHLVKRPTRKNAVLLMAGGFGTRLSPLTNNCPKPLLKVGESPLLEIAVKNFADAGFTQFYISTHYMPEKIRDYFGDGRKWGVNISYVHEEVPLGTAGALGLLPKSSLEDDIVIMNGDILTNIDFDKLLEFHQENQAKATMCVREYQQQIPYGVIETDGYKITGIKEKPTSQHFVNAGIYVVSPELLEMVSKGQYIDMTTLLELSISRENDVAVYPILDYWLDIGRLDDFQKAQIDVQNL
ncbi:MAG: nucleotidyltransferase family protein [Aliiglaciecola sp.]|uniref:nucleotidyltransferase family protein n=1 Tax=Aliiglaciecola sp. M165 TaxID=2593649 RepID=UPI00117F05FE|nr:nucleotidyltransferase family protein [Aliiglaciecola sp. M165]TRY30954.1 CBS domain-containing protein [Aliiglaciecola sp. M165]